MKTSQEKNIEFFSELIKVNIPDYKKEAETKFSHDFKKLWESKKYDKANSTVYKLLKEKYGNEVLNRKMIINLFKNEETYYEGFLCAMVWGKIGSYNIGWFEEVFKSDSSNKNEQKVKYIVNLLKKGKIEEAYDYLSKKDSKIVGVNEAFFTKLLYFAGAAVYKNNQSNLPFQPLIFDSIMKGVYTRLMKFIIGAPMPEDSFERYMDYCKKMEKWRELLDLETSGHVEALLFRP